MPNAHTLSQGPPKLNSCGTICVDAAARSYSGGVNCRYPRGKVSPVKLKADVRCRRRATGSAGSVAHGCLVARRYDFGVTDRRSVFAVHTRRVWAALRAVTTVKA